MLPEEGRYAHQPTQARLCTGSRATFGDSGRSQSILLAVAVGHFQDPGCYESTPVLKPFRPGVSLAVGDVDVLARIHDVPVSQVILDL